MDEQKKSSTSGLMGGLATLFSFVVGTDFGYYHAHGHLPAHLEGREWLLLALPAVSGFYALMDYVGKDISERNPTTFSVTGKKALEYYAFVQLGTGVLYGAGSVVGTLVDKLVGN